MKKYYFERIVDMLLTLNKEMNGGKEMLACDFLKRIDPLSDFMRQYEN